MKWLTPFRVLLVLLLLAATASWVFPPLSFEKAAIVAQATMAEDCAITRRALEKAPVDAAQVCAEWGTQAYLDTLRYPEFAPTLYSTYGNMPEWQGVIDRYGHVVLPIVWSYVEHGSVSQQFQNDAGKVLREVLAGEMPSFESETLTSAQQGMLAILTIEREGFGFLSRFEVDDDGTVSVRPLTTGLRAAEQFLLGGVTAVEEKLVRGEDVSFSEVGMAALDVAVLAIGGKALVVGIKGAGGKVAAKLGFKKAVAVTAKTAFAVGKKAMPLAATIGVGYVALTNPTLVAEGGSWMLEQIGIPSWLSWPMAWLLLALMVWATAWALTWPIRFVLRPVRMVYRAVT